jgi:hypothetical protein
MATTRERLAEFAGENVRTLTLDVNGGSTIYKGTIVCLDANGDAVPGGDIASGALTAAGCALATADYLAQLAAPDYPDKVEFLFAEFAESDAFTHVPMAERAFQTPRQLIEQTPGFWENSVLPRLNDDLGGLYHFLAEPYPRGLNPYLVAVEKNISIIRARLSAAMT